LTVPEIVKFLVREGSQLKVTQVIGRVPFDLKRMVYGGFSFLVEA